MAGEGDHWIDADAVGDSPITVQQIDRTYRKGGHDDGPLVRVTGFDLRCRDKLVFDNQARYGNWDTLGVYVDDIAGLHHRRDEHREEAWPSRPVIFAPEPHNPYDPQAVGVWLADGPHLGYVRKDGTRSLRSIMRSGPVCAAVWKTHRPAEGAGPPTMIQVMVFKPGRLQNAPTPEHPPWPES